MANLQWIKGQFTS